MFTYEIKQYEDYKLAYSNEVEFGLEGILMLTQTHYMLLNYRRGETLQK